jgi:hypothetical protein
MWGGSCAHELNDTGPSQGLVKSGGPVRPGPGHSFPLGEAECNVLRSELRGGAHEEPGPGNQHQEKGPVCMVDGRAAFNVSGFISPDTVHL